MHPARCPNSNSEEIEMSPNQSSIPERPAVIPLPSRPVNRLKPLGILVCLCLLVYGAISVWHFVGVSRQIDRLKDADPAIRQKAAEALGSSKSSRAVEPLIAALNDPDPSVQGSAATALGQIKDPRAIESLMAAFRDKDRRESALSGLVTMGSPAVDSLVAAMNDSDHDVRWESVKALGDIKDARAVEPLIAALQIKDIQWNAAHSLGQIDDPRAVEPLIAALNDKNPEFRAQAAQSLGEIKDSRAVAPLIAVLNAPPVNDPALIESDRTVRVAAANALGMIASPEAVNFLLAAFRERKAVVIAGADNFFIQRGEPGSEDVLIAALNSAGDSSMAVDFLNSGNQKLHDAAANWAVNNNYEIASMPGSGNATWGGKP